MIPPALNSICSYNWWSIKTTAVLSIKMYQLMKQRNHQKLSCFCIPNEGNKGKTLFEKKSIELKTWQADVNYFIYMQVCRLLIKRYLGLLRPSTYTAAKKWMKDCIRDVGLEVLGGTVAKKVAQMPCSSETTVKIFGNWLMIWKANSEKNETVKVSFSLKLDECTNTAHMAILLVYVWLKHDRDRKKYFFYFLSFMANKHNCELYKTIKDYIVHKCVWSWDFV